MIEAAGTEATPVEIVEAAEGVAVDAADAETTAADVGTVGAEARKRLQNIRMFNPALQQEQMKMRGGLHMKHIRLINKTLINTKRDTKGCGECQASCQSACKTSCTIANQKCESIKRR